MLGSIKKIVYIITFILVWIIVENTEADTGYLIASLLILILLELVEVNSNLEDK